MLSRLLCRIVGHRFDHGPWTWDGRGWECKSRCDKCGFEITGPVRAYGVRPDVDFE